MGSWESCSAWPRPCCTAAPTSPAARPRGGFGDAAGHRCRLGCRHRRIWAVLLVVGGPGPSARAVGWGLVAGVAGGIGTLMLYRGLARGQMSVVGPVSAVGAAVVPGHRGRRARRAARDARHRRRARGRPARHRARRGQWQPGLRPGRWFRLGGRAWPARRGPAKAWPPGWLFGILFIGLAQAGRDAGLWPVASEQTSTLVVTLATALRARQPLRIPVREPPCLPVLRGR